MKANEYQSYSEEEKNPQSSFTKHPKIKWKIRFFIIFYLTGSFLLIVGVHEFTTGAKHADLFVNLALIGMFIAIISVFLTSVFLRCPQCKTRMFSVKMMCNNKMPIGKNKYCPFCGFPGESNTLSMEPTVE